MIFRKNGHPGSHAVIVIKVGGKPLITTNKLACGKYGVLGGVNETGSRSPCMRLRSDPPNFGPIERSEKQTSLIILINEEINEANWMVSNSAKLDRRTKAAHSIWSLCE